MPTQVQNVVLPPIQKILPPSSKTVDDPAPRREEFEEALKSALKKSDDARTEPAKEKSKPPKAETKKGKDDKATNKTSAKPVNKPAQTDTVDKNGNSKQEKHIKASSDDVSA